MRDWAKGVWSGGKLGLWPMRKVLFEKRMPGNTLGYISQMKAVCGEKPLITSAYLIALS